MKFFIYAPPYTEKYGGNMVLYKLAKDIQDLEHEAVVFDFYNWNLQTPFNTQYVQRKAKTDEIVVYPCCIDGNPAEGTRVVRWILGPLKKTPAERGWSSSDYYFYYSTYDKENPVPSTNFLFTFWLNPLFQDKGKEREGSSFAIRKGPQFFPDLKTDHPPGSVEIPYEVSHSHCMEVFNSTKYFYCYDPQSFLPAMAALCGCVPIVKPFSHLSKKEWLETLYFSPYMKEKGIETIYGIAYGVDDIQSAEETLHLVHQQHKDIADYGVETVKRFVTLLKN